MAALLSDADVGLAGPAPSAPASSNLLSDADVGLGSPQADQTSASQGSLSNNGNEGWLSGTLKGAATAAVRGLSHIPGAFGDVANLADYATAGVDSLATGRKFGESYQRVKAAEAAQQVHAKSWLGSLAPTPSEDVVPSSDAISAPILAKTGAYVPDTAAGRIGMAAGEMAVGGLGGGAAGEGASLPGLVRGAVEMAPGNALAGSAGQTAAELTKSDDSPNGSQAAAIGASLVTGHLASSMQDAGSKLLGLGRDAATGRALLDTASDPAAVKAKLAAGIPDDGVPGSMPTTAELTGDGGLAHAQDQAAQVDPMLFNKVADANNAARLNALRGTAAADADPMVTAATFKDHLDGIDHSTQQVHDQMRDAHAQAVQNLNDTFAAGQQARQDAGTDFADTQNQALADRKAQRQDDLDAATSAGTDAANASKSVLVQQFEDRLRAAQDAVDAGNGAIGQAISPEVAGDVLRTHVQAAHDHAENLQRQAYAAVPTDLASVISNVKNTVRSNLKGSDPLFGVPTSGAEADLNSRILGAPDVIPFSALQTLDTRVSAAMADARRNPNPNDPQALSRLTALKNATMSAINDGVEHKRAWEDQQAARGNLDAEDTISGRLGAYLSSARNARDGAASADQALGGVEGRSSDSAGLRGTGSPTRGGFDGAARGSGISEPPLFNPDRLSRPVPPNEPRPLDIQAFAKGHNGIQDPTGDLKSMGMDQVRGLVAKPGQGLHPDKMREVAAEAGYLGADTDHAVANSTIGDLHDALASETPIYSVHDEDLAHRWNAYDTAKGEYDAARGQPVNKPAGDKRVREQIPLSAYADDVGGARANPGDPLEPNMTPEAAEALAKAKAAHVVKAKYGEGNVGKALDTNGFKGQYTTPPEAVARSAMRDYSSTKEFLDKANRAPEVVAQIGGLLTGDLRRRIGLDNVLTEKALTSWQKENAGSLRALREVDPAFGANLATTAGANTKLVRLGQDRDVALRQFETQEAAKAKNAFTAGKQSMQDANASDQAATKRAIADRKQSDQRAGVLAQMERDAGIAQSKAATGAKIAQAKADLAQAKKMPGAELAGKTDPSEVRAFMGKLVSDKAAGPTRTRQFMDFIAKNPAAVEGARKALVDHLVDRLSNSATRSDGEHALSGAKFKTYLNDHRAALQAVLPPDQLNSWHAVAHTVEREDAAHAAARVTGSASAARLLPAIGKAVEKHGGHSILGGGMALAMYEHLFDHLMEGNWQKAALAAGAAGIGYGAKSMVKGRLAREDAVRSAMFRDALSSPERARYYVQKAGDGTSGPGRALVRSLKRQLLAAQVADQGGGSRQAYARGGSPAPSQVLDIAADTSVQDALRLSHRLLMLGHISAV